MIYEVYAITAFPAVGKKAFDIEGFEKCGYINLDSAPTRNDVIETLVNACYMDARDSDHLSMQTLREGYDIVMESGCPLFFVRHFKQ